MVSHVSPLSPVQTVSGGAGVRHSRHMAGKHHKVNQIRKGVEPPTSLRGKIGR